MTVVESAGSEMALSRFSWATSFRRNNIYRHGRLFINFTHRINAFTQTLHQLMLNIKNFNLSGARVLAGKPFLYPVGCHSLQPGIKSKHTRVIWSNNIFSCTFMQPSTIKIKQKYPCVLCDGLSHSAVCLILKHLTLVASSWNLSGYIHECLHSSVLSNERKENLNFLVHFSNQTYSLQLQLQLCEALIIGTLVLCAKC